MTFAGDILLESTIDLQFTTVNTSGVATTLAGSPAVSAYIGNSTTQITAGITLTVDLDAVVGLHNVRVVATAANGYAAATNVTLVITTGTVGGSSVVGYVVGSFSIEHRNTKADIRQLLGSAIATPTVAGVLEVDVTHAGGTAINRHIGTASAVTATTITLDAAQASPGDGVYVGAEITILSATSGAQQAVIVTDYVGVPPVATIGAWPGGTPTGTITYELIPDAQPSSTVNANVISVAAGAITAAAIATNAIDDDALAADTDSYQARVYLFDDEAAATDRYVAVWHKNGMPVLSGITLPLIQVWAASTGTDLIVETAMTQIATTGTYRYNATTTARTTAGAAYMAKVSATIDGSVRVTVVPVGRDSTV